MMNRRRKVREVIFLYPGDVCNTGVEEIGAVRTCDGYARIGLDVRLVSVALGRRCDLTPKALERRYGTSSRLRVNRIRTLLRRANPNVTAFRLWAGLGSATLALRVLVPLAPFHREVVIHSRSPVMIAPFVALRMLLPRSRRPALIFETHGPPPPPHAGWIVRSVDLVVVNSSFLKRKLRELFGVREERLMHARLPAYAPVAPEDRDEARSALGLPHSVPIACYAGNLAFDQPDFLVETAAQLRQRIPDARFLIVGGDGKALQRAREQTRERGLEDTVILSGFVDPPSISRYLAAADVLVHYMSDKLGWYDYCTPAKGWDYQAAQRPIVVADIPLFEEVFGRDGERAIRVRERSPTAVADGIVQALLDPQKSRAMAERAARWITSVTWHERNRQILERLNSAPS
jgi:glycosyltransferase involved in cell wall biosynthesis